MENRLAIDTPKKIRLIHGYKVPNCTLVANKGDFMCRKYGLFGKKLFYEHDVWNFHTSFEHEMSVDDDPSYKRIGDELFVLPRVRVIYGLEWKDDRYFDTEQEAEKYFESLVSKFRLTEIMVENG